MKIPPSPISTIYFSFAPAYQSMISPVIAITNAIPISGIETKISQTNTLRTIKYRIILGSCMMFFFLINQLARNITYPSLKNSAGCIVVIQPRSIHHLAPLRITQIPGTNTNSCKIRASTEIIIIFLLF